VRDGKEVNGLWVTFGQENNKALGVPAKYREYEGRSTRFTVPTLDNDQWLKDFIALTNKLIIDARAGKHLDILLLDGLSEFDLLYEEVYNETHNNPDKFAKWDGLLREIMGVMQRVDADELGCHVVATARVMESKKPMQSQGRAVGGDPDFIDANYYPKFRGSFKFDLPHYFNLVTYMEEDMRLTEGQAKREAVNILHMVRDGDYLIKNQWKHSWKAAKMPSELINPRFWNVIDMLEKSVELQHVIYVSQ